jgi:hypothetical protein
MRYMDNMDINPVDEKTKNWRRIYTTIFFCGENDGRAEHMGMV